MVALARCFIVLASLVSQGCDATASAEQCGASAEVRQQPQCITRTNLGCAFDDVVSEEVLASARKYLLELEHLPEGTRWFSLRDSKRRRSPIHDLIGEVIAPTALGSDLPLYEGGDWWVQPRVASRAKEYHSDTDTELCHASKETDCHAADVGTVFFFDGNGGPTVFFNQTFDAYGLKPRIPAGLGLCDSRPARLLVFRGSLYHGVLNVPGLAARNTLLVNFWKSRPKEAVDEPANKVPKDEAEWPKVEMGPGHHQVELVKVPMKTAFDNDIDTWQKQRLPNPLADEMETQASKQPKAAGLYWVKYRDSNVNKQIPEKQRVPTWAYWT